MRTVPVRNGFSDTDEFLTVFCATAREAVFFSKNRHNVTIFLRYALATARIFAIK